jgi:carboxylesterase type B
MTGIGQFFLVLVLIVIIHGEVFVEVDTPLGRVKGVRGYGLNAFKGVPYAEVPKRWTPPVPKRSWVPQTLDATKFGPRCPQNRAGAQSEDCLTLNILSPLNATNAPVVVFIHGGAFDVGTSTGRTTLGDFFTNQTNTIHVSINYRLGALGFLDGLGERGNFGILDQRMAIQWVFDNIRSFGGNPNQITLTGHSAGCMSIVVLMVMKNPPPFSRVILMGVPFAVQYRRHSANEIYSTMFARNLGCDVCLIQISFYRCRIEHVS